MWGGDMACLGSSFVEPEQVEACQKCAEFICSLEDGGSPAAAHGQKQGSFSSRERPSFLGPPSLLFAGLTPPYLIYHFISIPSFQVENLQREMVIAKQSYL